MQQRVIVGFVVLLATAAACRGPQGPTVVLHGDSGAVAVAVEIAATPEAITRGLMYRQSLSDGTGMLFIFAEETEHSFWMKNTLIPLDMLFIARDGPGRGRIVGIHENAKPLSEAPISVGKPSAWVLEVPGGWTRRAGIKTGDGVTLPAAPAPSPS